MDISCGIKWSRIEQAKVRQALISIYSSSTSNASLYPLKLSTYPIVLTFFYNIIEFKL